MTMQAVRINVLQARLEDFALFARSAGHIQVDAGLH